MQIKLPAAGLKEVLGREGKSVAWQWGHRGGEGRGPFPPCHLGTKHAIAAAVAAAAAHRAGYKKTLGWKVPTWIKAAAVAATAEERESVLAKAPPSTRAATRGREPSPAALCSRVEEGGRGAIPGSRTCRKSRSHWSGQPKEV